jgi:hypothetical protein
VLETFLFLYLKFSPSARIWINMFKLLLHGDPSLSFFLRRTIFYSLSFFLRISCTCLMPERRNDVAFCFFLSFLPSFLQSVIQIWGPPPTFADISSVFTAQGRALLCVGQCGKTFGKIVFFLHVVHHYLFLDTKVASSLCCLSVLMQIEQGLAAPFVSSSACWRLLLSER